MARYLLDTNVLVSFSKGREPAYSWILSMIRSRDELGVCGVVVTEFLAGVPPNDRPTWDRFLRQLSYWEVNFNAATRAGIYRYTFARQGQIISTPDAQIAAVSVEVGAILVTRNVRHYPMPDVTLHTL